MRREVRGSVVEGGKSEAGAEVGGEGGQWWSEGRLDGQMDDTGYMRERERVLKQSLVYQNAEYKNFLKGSKK